MDTSVLLFSPGIDSYLGDWILSKKHNINLKRLYIDIGSRYSEYELYLLKKWYGPEYFQYSKCNIGVLEKEDAYLPNRNMILASYAQAFTNADYVYLNATYDDRVSDGSIDFRSHLSNTLSISSGKNVLVDSVLKFGEKSTWIKKFVDENPDKAIELLEKTYSCYNKDLYEESDITYYKKNDKYELYGESTIYGCLECKACYRKMCALVAANIYVPFINIDLIKEYMDEPIDQNIYKDRYETVNKYYEFMTWYEHGE